MNKNILITGTSTGFGRSLVETALASGHRVVATARKPQELRTITEQYPNAASSVELDIGNNDSVKRGVERAMDHLNGRLDVLINNAGYGQMGAIEKVEDEAIEQQYNTNVFGLLRMLRACLPRFRKQRAGHVVNFSSVGGFWSFEGAGVYCSTKFAIEGISEALAREVKPLGIAVTIVEPGAFRTDFSGRSMAVARKRIGDYAPTAGNWIDTAEKQSGKQPGDPGKAARIILRAIESDTPPLRLALGPDALKYIRQKQQLVEKDLSHWEAFSMSTNFDEAIHA